MDTMQLVTIIGDMEVERRMLIIENQQLKKELAKHTPPPDTRKYDDIANAKLAEVGANK